MMIQRWFFLLFLVCNSYLSCSELYHGFRSSLTSCSNHNIIINHRRNIINILSSLSYVLQYRLNPLHSSQQSSSSTSSSSSSSSSITVNPVVDEPINVFDKAELIKLFGRLADAKMLLDVPGAGTPEMMNCCHGGCSNCDYSRIFDQMSAGRPKWIPLYDRRTLIDGRSHKSTWSSIFDDAVDGSTVDDTVDQETFIARIQALAYRPCLGPPGSVDPNIPPSKELLIVLWNKMIDLDAVNSEVSDSDSSSRGGVETSKQMNLTASQIAEGLKKMTKQEHGATWDTFKDGFHVK